MSSSQSKRSDVQRGATGRNNISSRDKPIDRFLRSRNELSERQQNAVELLLHGMGDNEVATQVGVDRTTIFRWRKSIAFQRELDRQRRRLWEQSAGEIQSMVQPALSILRKQLASADEKVAIRAAAVLLRFATPSRLAPAAMSASSASPPRAAARDDRQHVDDLIAYIEAPLPGQPGAPEDLTDEDVDDLADGDEEDDDSGDA
jgi:HEAT repeat protein